MLAQDILFFVCIVLLTGFGLQCSHCGARLGVGARGRGSGGRSAQRVKYRAHIYLHSMTSEVLYHV